MEDFIVLRKTTLISGILALSMVVPAFAQEGMPEMPPLPENATLVATGLNGPRGLSVTADGSIYVAEVGAGGEEMVQTPEGEMPFGMTSSVSIIGTDGALNRGLSYLPSAAGTAGASGVAYGEEFSWVAINGGVPNIPLTAALLKVETASGRIVDMIDLFSYEAANNPDGNEIDSNPVSVDVAADGTVYVTDSGANTVYTYTDADGLQVFHVWPDNPVPTDVALAEDGSVYVSFLSPGEMAPGTAMVQQLSADGELVATFGDLTALTGITLGADGAIYVASLTVGMGAEGPGPGQVLRVSADGNEVVADGLMLPYGITTDANGDLLVTTGAAFLPPGTGSVVRIAVSE
jgi:hypothetical protein